MITLLLMRGPDQRALEVRRCGPATRVLARTRTYTLDRALATGTCPDSSPMLSLRAHALISTPHRERLAGELKTLERLAGRPHHPFNPGLPIPSHVNDAEDLIEEIADLLEGCEPVDARGVARLALLLRDGGGPLYTAATPESLRRTLQHIIDTLALPPPIHTAG